MVYKRLTNHFKPSHMTAILRKVEWIHIIQPIVRMPWYECCGKIDNV